MKLVNKKSFIVVAVAFLILSTSAIIAQNKQLASNQITNRSKTDDKNKELIAQLKKSIPQLMKDGEVPGLLIVVIHDAKVLWQQSFGVANSATNQPVGDDTIFQLRAGSRTRCNPSVAAPSGTKRNKGIYQI